MGTYLRGGNMLQVKQPVKLNFDTLSESIENPGMFNCDVMKYHHMAGLHASFRALDAFRMARGGAFPTPGDLADAQAFFDLVVKLNADAPEDGKHFRVEERELREADTERLIKRFALCCRGQVSPVCALIGGVLGQEVLKACSGKFMPVKQWYYFDGIDSLPDEPLPQADVTPVGCRFDGQIMVFGQAMQRQMGALNLFLVGAGAIGCEMLKNWAMMGLACSTGTVHVTDMDQIERSNLSRQFLFRNTDIGNLKSVTSVRAATAMNPQFRTLAYESKLAPDTESFFNDDFFEALDVVCAALDNVEARLYLDNRCLFYRKPMLESGTLGAKGHTQVVVPGLTEHYGATRDPPERGIPICTLKTFPNQIEHTLQWAREWFEEAFKQTPEDANKYIYSADFTASLAAQQNMKLDTLQRIKDALVDHRATSFDDCVVWARLRFEDMFCHKIKQLIHNLPLDKLLPNGQLFWSGAKKPPAFLEFDPSDPLHLEFVSAVASIRASQYGLAPCEDLAHIARVAASTPVPVFRPSQTEKVALTEEEAKEEAKSAAGGGGAGAASFDIDAQCDALLASLPRATALSGAGVRLVEADFDKDVDAHMRVVAACGNLRARNYRIAEADLHRARGIAGKIMPAIATTTAFVSGLVCLELFKLILRKPVEKFMCSFSNLAVPLFTSGEPNPPKFTKTMVKGKEWKWNQWDRIDVTGRPNMTLAELIAMLEEDYGAEVTMLSSGVSILFSSFMNRAKATERRRMPLKAIVESVTKKEVPAAQRYLNFEMVLSDKDTDEELEIPYLRFRLQ